ncbi:SMR family transporter [Tolypothrix sp. PCC 7910]|uniref:SMR family transporter n=1 Tax=Tolypothrix sp. PCC 7910 TaxID=2099387 RepID=UPI001FCC30AE|nr:SMR family transporter [Tolypothrix sp. PCC 7910]
MAIACEIFGTTSLKLADGFVKPIYLIGAVVGYPLTFSFFGLSLLQSVAFFFQIGII